MWGPWSYSHTYTLYMYTCLYTGWKVLDGKLHFSSEVPCASGCMLHVCVFNSFQWNCEGCKLWWLCLCRVWMSGWRHWSALLNVCCSWKALLRSPDVVCWFFLYSLSLSPHPLSFSLSLSPLPLFPFSLSLSPSSPPPLSLLLSFPLSFLPSPSFPPFLSLFLGRIRS